MRSGGDNDPLDVNINIQTEEQYGNAVVNNGPVPLDVEFYVIGGFIFPELSDGKKNEIYPINLLPILVFVNVSIENIPETNA